MQKWIVLLLCCWVFNVYAVKATCKVTYGDISQNLSPKPSRDPYHFIKLDLGGSFRFAAQVLVGPNMNKLKIYSYHDSKDRYVLIHTAEYQLEVCLPNTKVIDLGLNRVYSAILERELSYQCSLICS